MMEERQAEEKVKKKTVLIYRKSSLSRPPLKTKVNVLSRPGAECKYKKKRQMPSDGIELYRISFLRAEQKVIVKLTRQPRHY